MAEEGLRSAGFSSGLAVILKEDDTLKSRLVSSCDDIHRQPVEQTLEYILDLPQKSIHLSSSPLDEDFIIYSLKKSIEKYCVPDTVYRNDRDGISVVDVGFGLHTITIDEESKHGDINVFKQPLLIEGVAEFSSARANACVHQDKWMYEVTVETSGVQQIGWGAAHCHFTDQRGVGDTKDSYSFDGSRITKWNIEPESYGQAWVPGDVIGCCIDLDSDEISFYRNGVSLGVAFDEIRNVRPKLEYYPAISISQGERCNLNFGGLPFKYPIQDFHPLQSPPAVITLATYLLECLFRLLQLQYLEKFKSTSLEKLRRLKRFQPLDRLYDPFSCAIFQEFFSAVNKELGSTEYVIWGPFISFLMDVFGKQAPHDYESLDNVIDLFLIFNGSCIMFQHVIDALSYNCKTASLVLMDCPYSGSYSYLSLACYLLKRNELMILWWKSLKFEFSLEGFLSRKSTNKQDLQCLMPSVWWPGCEGGSRESSMTLATTALSGAINKIEEMHREICLLVIQFIPPTTPLQLPGSVFRKFIDNLLLNNRDEGITAPPGTIINSVLASVYTVILYFLSEGFSMGDICGWTNVSALGAKAEVGAGFLHRGGEQSFPVNIFYQNNPQRADFSRLGGSFSSLVESLPVAVSHGVIMWKEGFTEDMQSRVTHSTNQKPCCCSRSDIRFSGTSKDSNKYTAEGPCAHSKHLPKSSSPDVMECSSASVYDEVIDKPSSSNQVTSESDNCHVQCMKTFVTRSHLGMSSVLREELLMDSMLLMYHLALASHVSQASGFLVRLSQSISLLEETNKLITETSCNEQVKRLKESRSAYQEEVYNFVRQCSWFRISLFSTWKQRGMYATCMWLVQLLLALSRDDFMFAYTPEFYIETLIDMFDALRKRDPPFVSSAYFIEQGLASYITFIVTHFNDERISNVGLRDRLLQSMSALVQSKEYIVAFESNQAAISRMPIALISAFDNRTWIPATNILLALCKGSGFGLSKYEEPSSSPLFQILLRQACIEEEELFSAFLNYLFNTLSWTVTEFSVSIRDLQEKSQVMDLHRKKCSVVFDLSCKLARLLEFFSREIPQAFLSGSEMNMRRLTEMIIFVLNYITSAVDSEFFEMSFKRHGQSPEKKNRGMILAPLVGIVLNLLDASTCLEHVDNDFVGMFSSMECPAATVHCGFQYLLEFNWVVYMKEGDTSLERLMQVEKFTSLLRSRREAETRNKIECISGRTEEEDEGQCCICYACEPDTQFKPCSHRSCFGCITRHLLNNERCFFCNRQVVEVFRVDKEK